MLHHGQAKPCHATPRPSRTPRRKGRGEGYPPTPPNTAQTCDALAIGNMLSTSDCASSWTTSCTFACDPGFIASNTALTCNGPAATNYSPTPTCDGTPPFGCCWVWQAQVGRSQSGQSLPSPRKVFGLSPHKTCIGFGRAIFIPLVCSCLPQRPCNPQLLAPTPLQPTAACPSAP